MSEYSKFRNLDSFQCNVCHHFDRFNCTCSEEPYCVIEIERAYQQGRADAIKDFADWLVKYKVISDSAMHELIRDFKGEMG